MTLDAAWARRWMAQAAAALAAAKDELTELDRQIGDADHGVNLDRGFRAVIAKLEGTPSSEDETVGTVLKLVATTLMSTVGGASGPLYGTAFLRAARVTDRTRIDAPAVIALLEAALEGITVRGHATVGEKTMVDAWQPAAEAAAAVGDGTASEVLAAAAQAAAAGATATVPLVATKGRASYLGERSAGHEDPGARSTAILLAAAVAATAEEP